MKVTSKGRLAGKLAEYPLLRVLLFEFWFRVAFVLFVLLVIFMSLFLPKIWRTAPPDFLPVVRVSGLDMLQSWSLRRTASALQQEKKYEEAAQSWQMAVVNNAGDPQNFEGAIRNLLENPQPQPRLVDRGLGHCLWLMRLTHTNQTSLELFTTLLARHHMQYLTARFLQPLEGQLAPNLQATYLKALFLDEQMPRFATYWEQNRAQLPSDPELPIYYAAYQIGWGPPGSISEGRRALKAAMADPQHTLLAHRLNLTVSAFLVDPDDYARSLEVLEKAKVARLNDRIGWWRLLVLNGQKTKARELVQNYVSAPQTAMEAMRLAAVYQSLDLSAQARELYARTVPEFRFDDTLSVAYANFLIETKSWDALRELAVDLRQQDSVRNVMQGYCHYLEGRAELGQQRVPFAEAAFERIAGHEFGNLGLAMQVSKDLTQLGYAKLANGLLQRLESSFAKDPNYWFLVFNSAYELRDLKRLTHAAKEAYRLRPNQPAYLNNYAAALLLNREQPEEAVMVTRRLLEAYPRSLYAHINHALALLLNQRADEAEKLLNVIPLDKLNEMEATMCQLAWFQVHQQRGAAELANAAREKIKTDYLFSEQVEWLKKAGTTP